MLTLEDLKIRIVSVIGSEKNGCTGNDLCRLYKDMYGKDLNSKDYGFNNLESLLVSPAMQGEGGILCENGRYFAAGDKNTRNMLHLIRNTKSRRAKSRRGSHVPMPARFVRGRSLSISASSTHSDCTQAEKLHGRSQAVEKEAIATKQVATKFQKNANGVSKSALQANPNAKFFTRYVESPHGFENQQARLIAPIRAWNKYQSMSTKQSYVYDGHSVGSISGIQLQSHLNEIEKNRMKKSQKGKKRLVKLIEKHGGEMSFSEMKNSYLQVFGVPLSNTEICRLFSAKEEEIQDLYIFLKNCLCNDVVMTKLAEDDFLLRVIDDDDDIDEAENHGLIDNMNYRPLLPTSAMMQNDISHRSFNPNQHRCEFQNRFNDPAPTMDDGYEYWTGSTLASAIRSRDDYLPYKVLGDKVLSFVRAKGPFKVSDLSKIFFEEDGRCIDPKRYAEGTWENLIQKLLSTGRHPELTVRDGILDLRKNLPKSIFPSAHQLNDCTTSTENEKDRSMPLIATNSNVPAAAIYDLLTEAGRPLSQKELFEKLTARGIKVNICELTVKLITKFKDVFCCQFHSKGAWISLAHGAKRPEETNVSSCLPAIIESVKIVTHVMSNYCSTTESASNIFKSVLLINIVLIDEVLDRFRIQASFRLRSCEITYNSFKKKMRLHYLSYGQEKDYAVEKPIKGCNYAFHDIKDNQVYRVQCVGDGDHAVMVYLIDEMRYQNAPVSQLRKLTTDYAGPAYGVVAKTAAFMAVPERENEFREYFSLVRSKLLGDTTQDIQADVVSEPSNNLFELKQLYSEVHDNLNVPATFVRQCLIQIISSKS
ncbi:unnamed protein product [Cercopithifilaria johnstoni]|uniref:HTH OST-type domain-containing protein n=1 Tax=Cercopithifilaria johnstoni TaxID=2874296 RepID=A0A8J2Q8U3_9BILA|nr:unnamed protein product [Cercopithifilaria johnstoni]